MKFPAYWSTLAPRARELNKLIAEAPGTDEDRKCIALAAATFFIGTAIGANFILDPSKAALPVEVQAKTVMDEIFALLKAEIAAGENVVPFPSFRH